MNQCRLDARAGVLRVGRKAPSDGGRGWRRRPAVQTRGRIHGAAQLLPATTRCISADARPKWVVERITRCRWGRSPVPRRMALSTDRRLGNGSATGTTGYYAVSPATDPQGPESTVTNLRVIRGDAQRFALHVPRCSPNRLYNFPTQWSRAIGFRCARDPSASRRPQPQRRTSPHAAKRAPSSRRTRMKVSDRRRLRILSRVDPKPWCGTCATRPLHLGRGEPAFCDDFSPPSVGARAIRDRPTRFRGRIR